jgi:plastocyanin
MKITRTLALLLLLTFAACCRAQVGSLNVTVRTAAGQPVADAVVVAVPTDPAAMAGAKPRAEQLEQIDKEFVPKVKPVYVGSTVAFPNKDSVRHHVYSFSPAKRFTLPLYAGVPSQPVLFDKAGVVVLGCNIHDWMIGYIYVSDSPWFAKTGADGKAQIADLPARGYTLRVWHAQQEGTEEETRKPLDIAAGQRAEALFTLALRPEVRVRRSPTGSHAGHY